MPDTDLKQYVTFAFEPDELNKLNAEKDKDISDIKKNLNLQFDMETAPPSFPSYLEAALHNTTPDSEPAFLPPPIDITRSVRFGLRITVPTCAKPLELLFKTLKHMFRIIKSATNGR